MEQIRSFIAIELPDDLKAALTRLEDELKSHDPPAIKWVDPRSIHLTLKFLGNVDAGRVAGIAAAIERAALGVFPFHLEVKGLGVFPNPRRVQVVWVGVSGEVERLVQLQQRIEAAVSPLGFPTESRPFAPHLTIARLREQATFEDRQGFGALISGTTFDLAYRFAVDSVDLMRSQLTREGPIYSRLASVKLL